jgi:hypothetical protein
MRTLWVFSALVVAGLTAGCAGRMANPAAEATIYDRYMSCGDIRAEVAGSYEAQSALVRERVWAQEKNDMIRGLSIAFPPGFFAIDDTVEEASGEYKISPQEIDGSALATRARHLIATAQERQCWPGSEYWMPS